jgi:hypothetical protein
MSFIIPILVTLIVVWVIGSVYQMICYLADKKNRKVK